MISAGHDHSLVLTKTGLVYSFGSGINGRHGHGETTNQWHPKPIKSLEREFIRFIEAGASHSFAVNRQGELFAWGLGGSGQLGLGPCEPTYQRIKPTKVEYFTFEHIEVKQVSAGAAHTLVVDTDASSIHLVLVPMVGWVTATARTCSCRRASRELLQESKSSTPLQA